jgi:membrane-associated phospholipid phosphatase
MGIWFAAVYSGHHYLLDVLAGVACAITGIFIFQRFIVPNKTFQEVFIKKFVKD